MGVQYKKLRGGDMKLLLIVITVFIVNLYASEELDFSIEYAKAVKSYQSKDYKSSYEILSKLYKDNLLNADLNFYLGRAAYETGHYEMALAAFERVEMLDSSNLANRLQMARTYFMLKMYEDSENAFKEVLENPNIPKNVRTNIELSLSKVSKVQKKSFTYARVMANIMYDSNVNYGSIGDYQYGGSNLSKIDSISDTALEVYGNIVNIYDIGSKDNFAIKNSVAFYIKDYKNESHYDMQYLVYNPSILFQGINYLIDFNIGIDFMNMDKALYLRTYFIAPTLEYKHTTTLKSIAKLKYQRKDFTQARAASLDANRYELQYGVQKILSPRSYTQGNINSVFERKLNGDNYYVDFNEYKANVVYANQITTMYSIDCFAQIRAREYLDTNPGFGSKREDLGGLVNMHFGIKILPTLRGNFKGSYEYVDSNHERYSYDKYILSAGLIKTF